MMVNSNDSNSVIVKKLTEYIVKEPGAESEEFSKKAIESLVKKLKEKKEELDSFIESVVEHGDFKKLGSNAPPPGNKICCTIMRTLDGRLQVAGRKGFPHVVYARIFRFGDISKNEMRHTQACRYGFELKREQVCINPFHYEKVPATVAQQSSVTVGMSSGLQQNITNNAVLLQQFPRVPPASTLTGVTLQQHNNPVMPLINSFQNRLLEQRLEQPSTHIHPTSLAHSFPQTVSRISPYSALCLLGAGVRPSSPGAANVLQLTNGSNRVAPVSTAAQCTPTCAPTAQPISPQETKFPFKPVRLRDTPRQSAIRILATTMINHDPPFVSLPKHWASIQYYELELGVGEAFRAQFEQPSVVVDGYTQPAAHDRFSLGKMTSLSRTDAIDRARLHIGNGIKLDHDPATGDVTLECLTPQQAVFVQSAYLDRWSSTNSSQTPNPNDSCIPEDVFGKELQVNKIVYQKRIKVFSLEYCLYTFLRNFVRMQAEPPPSVTLTISPSLKRPSEGGCASSSIEAKSPRLDVKAEPRDRLRPSCSSDSEADEDDRQDVSGESSDAISLQQHLDTICSVRVAFIKGFGKNYRKKKITETPCWVDIRFFRPLRIIDYLLTHKQQILHDLLQYPDDLDSASCPDGAITTTIGR